MSAFKTGSLVWAKLGNYPPWPARITNLEQVDKDVRSQLRTSWGPDDKLAWFFGSHNHAWISPNLLWDFEEHFDDYQKCKKPSKAFALALREIEKYRKTGKLEVSTPSDDSSDSSESEGEKPKEEKSQEKDRKAQEREKKRLDQAHRRAEKLRKSAEKQEEKFRREQELRESLKTPVKKDKKSDSKRKRIEDSDEEKQGSNSADDSSLPSKKRKIRDAVATPDANWKKSKSQSDSEQPSEASAKIRKKSTPSARKDPAQPASPGSSSSSSSPSPPQERASAHREPMDGAVSTAAAAVSDHKPPTVAATVPALPDAKPLPDAIVNSFINSLIRHPIAKYLKFSVEGHSKGTASAKACFSDARTANKMEIHSCIASLHFLLDTVSYVSIIQLLKEGEAAYTQDIHVTALRPIPQGNEFTLRATVTHHRNKLIFIDAEAHFKGELCFVAKVIKSIQDEIRIKPESHPDGKPKPDRSVERSELPL
eukprot:TRINITY_DN18584_c0_g1_i1.p1 TRINITY_DN18584_c0_g1~~TRINITY_DN18584_c0_g1_i1.p1  ORF type:complete len:481 (+),score=56.15 TRINITY_DN18584_c0_g1_i1:181-1623(+)